MLKLLHCLASAICAGGALLCTAQAAIIDDFTDPAHPTNEGFATSGGASDGSISGTVLEGSLLFRNRLDKVWSPRNGGRTPTDLSDNGTANALFIEWDPDRPLFTGRIALEWISLNSFIIPVGSPEWWVTEAEAFTAIPLRAPVPGISIETALAQTLRFELLLLPFDAAPCALEGDLEDSCSAYGITSIVTGNLDEGPEFPQEEVPIPPAAALFVGGAAMLLKGFRRR